jgi:hypothetical protein
MASCTLLQENADFLYADVWSANSSWGGSPPPEEGSLAVITKGQIILLDQSTPILKMLLIQGKIVKICILDSADYFHQLTLIKSLDYEHYL